MLKLLLDFSTEYLKKFDGPYYKTYRKEVIHLARRFYKLMHKQDAEEEKEGESRLSKQIKKMIEKAISKTERSRAQAKELKQKLSLEKTAKQMLKFYKKEREIYSGPHLSLDKSAIYE